MSLAVARRLSTLSAKCGFFLLRLLVTLKQSQSKPLDAGNPQQLCWLDKPVEDRKFDAEERSKILNPKGRSRILLLNTKQEKSDGNPGYRSPPSSRPAYAAASQTSGRNRAHAHPAFRLGTH